MRLETEEIMLRLGLALMAAGLLLGCEVNGKKNVTQTTADNGSQVVQQDASSDENQTAHGDSNQDTETQGVILATNSIGEVFTLVDGLYVPAEGAQ